MQTSTTVSRLSFHRSTRAFARLAFLALTVSMLTTTAAPAQLSYSIELQGPTIGLLDSATMTPIGACDVLAQGPVGAFGQDPVGTDSKLPLFDSDVPQEIEMGLASLQVAGSGVSASTDECFDDLDCPPDEFCHKMGANDCRDKKEEGDVCSRHGKCLSGCCKVHISWPFQKTCRPPESCW